MQGFELDHGVFERGDKKQGALFVLEEKVLGVGAGNASAQDATGERIVQTDATAPVVEQVASAIVESGDLRAALIMTHREEWVEIDFIRTEAIQAFKNPTFRPEDAGEKWDSKSRLAHAAKLISSYNTAANALLVKQEGQRRAHGFDYKTQILQNEAQTQDAIDQQAEVERLIDLYELAVRTANGTLIQKEVIDG